MDNLIFILNLLVAIVAGFLGPVIEKIFIEWLSLNESQGEKNDRIKKR